MMAHSIRLRNSSQPASYTPRMEPVAWIGVGGAAAGAVELCPAVGAVGPGVGVAGTELLPQGGVGNAVPHVPQLVGFLPHELVAGVQVAPGGDRHVLRAGAAAGDPLVDAGAAGEVQHIVVEGDGPALLLPARACLSPGSHTAPSPLPDPPRSARPGHPGAQTTGSMLSSVKPRSSAMWNRSLVKSGFAWVKVPRM